MSRNKLFYKTVSRRCKHVWISFTTTQICTMRASGKWKMRSNISTLTRHVGMRLQQMPEESPTMVQDKVPPVLCSWHLVLDTGRSHKLLDENKQHGTKLKVLILS